MPPPLLLAPPPLLLVLALLVGCAAAAMDVAAQLQLLSGPLAPPAAPAELSGRLELELGGVKLSALSAALQRALLWDAGWLRLGGEDSEYVQVLVPCGSHMDAAVLDEGEVEGCVAESECRRPSGNASAWSCGDAEQVARCAVVVDGGEQLEIADNATWPLVAVDAVIDAGFDPQLLRFTGGADQTQVIVIASRGEWRTQGAFCLQGPLFVSPCVVLNATSSSRSSSSSGSSGSSSVSNTTGWCEPTRTSTVSAWLQSELEDLEHQVVATSSSSSSSSSDGDNDTPLLIGMIVAGVVLIAIISIPFCLAHRNQRKSRQQMAAPARRRCHEGATPSRSEPDQSLSASDFRLLTDR